MGIPVKLQAFEGPLDLLLHLIDKNKVNIYDIPIALITDQYMEYINAMETKDLGSISEFLVMAATLLSIKSKMLLPAEVNEDGEEEDPRKELVEQLLEYKMYKYMSFELKDRQLDAARVLYKQPTVPAEVAAYEEPVDPAELLEDLTLSKLNQIFKSIVRKQQDKIDPVRSKFGTIEKEDVNLPEKIAYIEEYGRKHKTYSFRHLLQIQHSKTDIVVTFLAVLELMKIGKLMIAQAHLFDDIQITAAG